MNQTILTTSALTILRVVPGFLFAAHGWQKFNEWTVAGTQAAFAKMGVPAAELAAPVVAALELAGGVAPDSRRSHPVFAALLTINMLGALFLVHAPAGSSPQPAATSWCCSWPPPPWPSPSSARANLPGPGPVRPDGSKLSVLA